MNQMFLAEKGKMFKMSLDIRIIEHQGSSTENNEDNEYDTHLDNSDMVTDTNPQNNTHDRLNEIQKKMDQYNSEDLSVAIYQFLNETNEDTINVNETQNKEKPKKVFQNVENDKGTPYTCGVCKKEFAKLNGLVIHLKVHDGDQSLTCKECNVEFPNRSYLRKHMITHGKDRPYKCETCGKTFILNQQLQSHLVVHSNPRPFNCGVCGKTFNRKYHIKRHMETHVSNKSHTCPVCGISVTRKEGLTSHILTHKQNVSKCKYCQKLLTSELRLKNHIEKKHSNEFSNLESNIEVGPSVSFQPPEILK